MSEILARSLSSSVAFAFIYLRETVNVAVALGSIKIIIIYIQPHFIRNFQLLLFITVSLLQSNLFFIFFFSERGMRVLINELMHCRHTNIVDSQRINPPPTFNKGVE